MGETVGHHDAAVGMGADDFSHRCPLSTTESHLRDQAAANISSNGSRGMNPGSSYWMDEEVTTSTTKAQ
jgi:hypothetical protein